MSVLQPALEAIHFVRSFCFYVFQFLYFVGRSVFWLLAELYVLLRDLLFAFVIVGEELYRFLCELDDIVSEVGRYVQTSTNSGVGSVIEAMRLFGCEILKFCRTTRVFTRIFATRAGGWVVAFFVLLRDAMLLIADSLWIFLTIVPRLLVHLLLFIGDGIVFIVGGASSIALSTAHAIMDDIFRLTIVAVLVFLLWRHRSGMAVVLSVFWNNVRTAMQQFQLLDWIERLRNDPLRSANISFLNSRLRRSPLERSASPALSTADKVSEELRCVACRDRAKCVVLLPCRHLCLCEECADYMKSAGNINYCPLCRDHVAYTISVYV